MKNDSDNSTDTPVEYASAIEGQKVLWIKIQFDCCAAQRRSDRKTPPGRARRAER
jgi:hypothetical protein